MSPKYAANTSVSTDKSRSEIEQTLRRYGADGFAFGWEGARTAITFRIHERQVRFVLTLPDRREFARTPTGRTRSEAQIEREWEQACRQRWRALALAIKAKLESVEAGIEQFEEAFLAQIVLPDGSTTGDWVRPQIGRAYETGTMPSMLPALGSGTGG